MVFAPVGILTRRVTLSPRLFIANSFTARISATSDSSKSRFALIASLRLPGILRVQFGSAKVPRKGAGARFAHNSGLRATNDPAALASELPTIAELEAEARLVPFPETDRDEDEGAGAI
jgi:hypothetical protein